MHSDLVAGGALLLWLWHAEAHLVTTGLGPVYDGIGHLLVTPEDLLPVLALALCAGLRGAGSGRRVLGVLPGAWLVGGCVGLLAHGLPVFPLPALAIGLGLGLGMRNGVAMQQAGAGLLGLLGMLAALFVLIALVAACVVSLHQQWARMAVRVAGSWLATIGLLMLGWALRGGNRRIVLHTAPIVVLVTLVGLHATTQTQEALKADSAELPKELQNPMATLIGMPLQAHWGVEPRQASLGVLGGVPPEVVCGAPPVVIRSKTCAHGMGDNASRGMTMLTEFVGIAKERARLKAQYLPKFKQVLPPRKAVRFYQMENKLDIAILAEMAQAIPLAR